MGEQKQLLCMDINYPRYQIHFLNIKKKWRERCMFVIVTTNKQKRSQELISAYKYNSVCLVYVTTWYC